MDVLRFVEVVGAALLIFGILNDGFLAGRPLDRMRLPGVSRGDPAATPPAGIVARTPGPRVTAAGMVVISAGRRRYVRRLWPGATVGGYRPDQNRDADAHR